MSSSFTSSSSLTSNAQYDNDSITQGLVLPPAEHCFHCGDPVPKPPFHAQILGQSREMCCMGCQLASESIVEAGLEQYYLDRSEINRTASLPTQLTRLEAYDHNEIKSQFVYAQDGLSVAELSVNNLRCAAWAGAGVVPCGRWSLSKCPVTPASKAPAAIDCVAIAAGAA